MIKIWSKLTSRNTFQTCQVFKTWQVSSREVIWNQFLNKFALRILVLDDEPFMLKLLSHMLNKLGFSQVTTYDSGRTCQGAIGFIAA